MVSIITELIRVSFLGKQREISIIQLDFSHAFEMTHKPAIAIRFDISGNHYPNTFFKLIIPPLGAGELNPCFCSSYLFKISEVLTSCVSF